MIIRSRAPLRLGLAGGGTDVSPYSDLYGGNILNATINQYAYATIRPRTDKKILVRSFDQGLCCEYASEERLPMDGVLDLLKGVYNRITKDYNTGPLSFELNTYVEAPAGSGLGTSSTLVVAVVGAFCEWLKLPLGDYDIAHLSYEIERIDMALSGGKQDQYAATFGGFNFMEFYKEDRVIVNPLRINPRISAELEMNFVLYYTGNSRSSARIIDDQVKNVKQHASASIEAMHKLKQQANLMKNALVRGELEKIGKILNFGWENKKRMTSAISNKRIDDIYETVLNAGATGGKISGAGGGGFMFFFCPENTRFSVIEALRPFGGEVRNFQFIDTGLTTWTC